MLQLRYWLNAQVTIPTTTITWSFCMVSLFVVTITQQTVLMNAYCNLQRDCACHFFAEFNYPWFLIG